MSRKNRISMQHNRIISFDVGIKNMAYCIFDVVSSPLTISIVDWNVLNVAQLSTEEKEECPTCQYVMTSGKQAKDCGKKSKYHKQNHYVWEKHAKVSHKYRMPLAEHSEKHLKKMKHDALKELSEKESIFSIKPEGTKKQDLVDYLAHYYKTYSWEANPKPAATKGASTIDLVTVGRNLHTLLSRNPHVADITHVVIENQISPIANRMKTVQGMLAQYFISIHEVPIIEFVSSANKLKDFAKDAETTEKSTYKKHKSDGIRFCRQLLDTYFASCVEHFEQYPQKKDDLADCFLQGIWYVNKKIITNADNLKINNVTTP